MMRYWAYLLGIVLVACGCQSSSPSSGVAPTLRATGAMPGMGEYADGSALLFAFGSPADLAMWRPMGDRAIGGNSSGYVRGTSRSSGVFAGTVQPGQSGGFVSFETLPGLWDLSSYDGLEIRVRGDGKNYSLQIKSGSDSIGQVYTSPFKADRDWKVIRLPLNSFRPDGNMSAVDDAINRQDISAFGLLKGADSQTPFYVEIEYIKLYRTGLAKS